ncbi:MAG: D-glycero-beta-D-manno-heptose 1-phosphate adenylyltransferase [Thermodesulfobacteriota bacterium]
MDWPAAKARIEEARGRGAAIVFTNGCFDLLHVGHLRYLTQARTLGGFLVVGVNSDRSVREIKGPGRPITPQDQRAEVLAGLTVVDAVVIFDQADPLALISHLEPDVLVKGGDWTVDQIVGREVVLARGGRVLSLPLTPGLSTTGLLGRALELNRDGLK